MSARGEGAGDAERYAKVRERWDALTDKQRANRISWFREFHRVDQEMSDWDIIPPDLFCQCEHSWPCDPVVLLAANDRLERDLAAALARADVSARWSARWRSLADLYRTAARDYLAVTEAKDAALAAKGRAARALELYADHRPNCEAYPNPYRSGGRCECGFSAALAEARGEPGGEGP